MRRCPRSEEVRQALAAEDPLTPDLAAHVATCANCANTSAAARRFDARLDATVADLVTDALPPTTAMAARMAPHATRQGPRSGTLASTLLVGAFVIFAAVGVVATGASISDAMRSGAAVEPQATEPDLERVDCYVGGSIVEVTVERVGDTGPEGIVAYCFGVEPPVADRQAAIECRRSAAAAAAAAAEERRARESAGTGGSPTAIDPQGDGREACPLDEGAEGTDRPVDADTRPSTSSQFDSWDEAAGSTAWPVLRPGWLPDGYDLAALQGFSGDNGREAVDWVSATYLRNGILLSFDQFEILDPDDPNVEVNLPGFELGDVSAGQTMVGDLPAFWASGLVGTLGGSEVEVLELVWNDGRVGYRITARNEDLEVLGRIAESLTDR